MPAFKQLMQELEDRSEHPLRKILESIGDYVVVLDRAGNLLYVNHIVSEEHWQKVKGSSIFNDNWVSREAQEELRTGLRLAFEEQKSSEIEMRGVDVETKELTATFHSRLYPLIEDGATYAAVYISTEITKLKQAEEERRLMDDQIRTAQKLESLGVLAGGIAHDFNNILVAIMGYADLAHDDLPATSEVKPMLAHIRNGAQKAAELCNQMLAYSGKGRFLVQSVDMNAIIKDLMELLEVSVSKKAEFVAQLSPDLPPVEADASQLNQVILNLITNASDALQDRPGTITITTSHRHCDSAYLHSSWLKDDLPEGDYVQVEVSDSGCGMDAQTMRRVFDPFFTTKFTGRGLGMAAVLGIIRGHRGAIRIASEVGKGSTFTILLPAVKRTAPGPAPDRTLSALPQDMTVLIVDDEPTICEFVTKILHILMGYTVLTAANGREAVEKFKERGDEIGLVILDMTMPEMSGEETFGELRRLRSDVRVLLSSGYDHQEAVARFAGRDLAGFLQKPYTVDQFKKALQVALK